MYFISFFKCCIDIFEHIVLIMYTKCKKMIYHIDIDYLHKMKARTIINIAIIIIAIYLNYEMYATYNRLYVPKYFSREKLLYKKYRCIRVLENYPNLKYANKNCKEYKHEYLNYKLERSRYTYEWIVYNTMFLLLLCI